MRQVLFRIWLEQPWSGWTVQPNGPEKLGACWVWLILAVIFLTVTWGRGDRKSLRDPAIWLWWGGGLLVLTVVGRLGLLPESLPVFGYGMLVLIGFLGALAYGQWAARKVGFNQELVMDVATWILIFGVAGGRTAYLVQYSRHVFAGVQSVGEAVFRAVNLAEGGLVLIGALVGGTLGFLAFCIVRRVNPFQFADIIVPGVFIGVGFGRLGCLLNGCCFGDRCDLPWAIRFPAGSLTFQELVMRGFVDPDALATMPLHPTQIYSSINGFVLFIVLATFFWYRRSNGDVFGLACILYPLARIQLEFLRADEMGQLGTGLTISQLYSLGILVFGVLLLVMGDRKDQLWHRWTGTAVGPSPQQLTLSTTNS